MTLTPQQYRYIMQSWEESAARMRAFQREMLAQAEQCPVPSMDRLRPATAADVVVGAVLWYPPSQVKSWLGPCRWKIVQEVIGSPSDSWKGYTAHDGCRYGLAGAFVETTDQGMTQ